MNKTDLINGMAENAGITKAAAKKSIRFYVN
jgi:nucleoid DNA-binding protein